MNEQLSLAELGLLVLVFGVPVYSLATAALIFALRRTEAHVTSRARMAKSVALVVALPATIASMIVFGAMFRSLRRRASTAG
jgi:hypothetical protein